MAGIRGAASVPAASSAGSGAGGGTRTPGQQVRDAYRSLAARPGDFVSIADLKDRMGGSEADKDRVLAGMFARREVNLVPQSNQQALTARQRQAAVRVGGESKHRISVAR